MTHITMHIDKDALRRIDQAARISGKNLDRFIIEEALKSADELLPNPDRTRFTLNAADYQRVLDILAQPPANDALTRLLTPSGLPWMS